MKKNSGLCSVLFHWDCLAIDLLGVFFLAWRGPGKWRLGGMVRREEAELVFYFFKKRKIFPHQKIRK